MAMLAPPPVTDTARAQRRERIHALVAQVVREDRELLDMLAAYDRGEVEIESREHLPRRRD